MSNIAQYRGLDLSMFLWPKFIFLKGGMGMLVMSDQAHYSVYYCYICSLPVLLTDKKKVKVDDVGKPVHEGCYMRKITGFGFQRDERETQRGS